MSAREGQPYHVKLGPFDLGIWEGVRVWHRKGVPPVDDQQIQAVLPVVYADELIVGIITDMTDDGVDADLALTFVVDGQEISFAVDFPAARQLADELVSRF